MKDSAMSMPESQEEESSPSQNMQMELHSKGAVLTKAWSDLFSFITKYQAELTVKENAVEIAEREINVRKRQWEEMKPMVESGNDEISKLQDKIRTKEQLLNKSQSELSVKEQMLRSVQSDLSCNLELLEKARCDLLDRQSELVHNRSDLERLKSELTIKQAQIQIKDNLLQKLQNQLMKENAELKQQLELEKQKFELEQQSHERTKRNLRDKSKQSMSTSNVIEIPDSPPTLDLSVEQPDFGISNIISVAAAQSIQPMGQNSQPSQSHSASQTLSRQFSNAKTSTCTSMTVMPTNEQSVWPVISPSGSLAIIPQSNSPLHSSMLFGSHKDTDNFNISNTNTSASDVFFPLSISQSADDDKNSIDKSVGGVMVSSEMNDLRRMPGLELSEGGEDMPVPVSGPIPSTGISPPSGMSLMEGMQEGTDGKSYIISCILDQGREDTEPNDQSYECPYCEKTFKQREEFNAHMRKHTLSTTRPYRCENCERSYMRKDSLKEHRRIHTGEKPYACKKCSERFTFRSVLNNHKCIINKEFQAKTNRKKYMCLCPYCGKSFARKDGMKEHMRVHTGEKPYCCYVCDRRFANRTSLKKHKCS